MTTCGNECFFERGQERHSANALSIFFNRYDGAVSRQIEIENSYNTTITLFPLCAEVAAEEAEEAI